MPTREKYSTSDESVETKKTTTRTSIKTDTYLLERIENQLKSDSRINYEVNVKVDEGVVTLIGDAPSYRAKKAANNIVWTVKGVVDVDNRISVSYKRAEDIPSDVEIALNVERSLSWDLDVDARDISVTAEKGILILRGTVDSIWKLELAEDISWNHLGVTDVINKLAVSPSEEISDKIAAQQIVDAIDRNKNIDLRDVDVRVKDGVDTFSGSVNDVETWRTIHDAVSYSSGIKQVDDNLKIV